MRKREEKQVSVISFGSSGITAAVAMRGVNDTFLIKGKKVFPYEGFQEQAFLDIKSLSDAVSEAIGFIKQTAYRSIGILYVGVPGAFTSVILKDSQISFERKKRITDSDLESLFDAAFVSSSKKYKLINRSSIYYELDDTRRLADPVGSASAFLKGKLSFTVCNSYFIDTVDPLIKGSGIENTEYVSLPLAEAIYLISPEERDRTAIVADIGYLSTTFTVVHGDGVLYQKSFDYGGGYITATLSNDCEIDFSSAEELKRAVNLCVLNEDDCYEIESYHDKVLKIGEVNAKVSSCLDILCEELSGAMDSSGIDIPEYLPLLITGGGISYMRGAKEHISRRLNVAVKILAPKVPMLDKPTESSVLSLLDIALNQ